MHDLTPYQKKQYERTIEQLKDDKSANLQVVLVAATAGLDKGVEDQSQIFPPPPEGQGMGITAALCLQVAFPSNIEVSSHADFYLAIQYPVSRGTVHIKSADPTAHPAVDPAFMSHPADAAVLGAGLKV